MRKIALGALLMILFLSGCNDKKQAGFGEATSCEKVYEGCMSKCLKRG